MIDSRKVRGPRFREWLAASVLAVSITACSAREAPVTEPPHPTPPPPKAMVTPPPKVAMPPPPHRPEFGEYLYVEELPEAVKKVDPVYPDDQERVHGVVMVQALVLEDGSIGDARVVDTEPGQGMLGDAAIACVRQWRFKPAMSGGKPVAVWVAIPIRFGPH